MEIWLTDNSFSSAINLFASFGKNERNNESDYHQPKMAGDNSNVVVGLWTSENLKMTI